MNQSNLIKEISWACGAAAGSSSPAAAPATPLRPRRGPAPPTATPLGDYSSSALWRNNVAVLRLWMGGGSAAVEAQTPRQGVDDKIL
jgi:hypothetical protein